MKKIAKEDWMTGAPKFAANFDKDKTSGSKGQLMVELQKSYKGDDRFKLDRRFEDDLEADKLPD